MATEKQIAANRRNAMRSTGPTSDDGKSRSRLNATQHGLAGELPEAELSPKFLDRRAKWAADFRPEGEAAEWALDRAVTASLRIERCEQAIDGLCASVANRAELSWDEDRSVEAARVFARIARDPILVSRQLQTTLAGVRLLIDAWLGLAAVLETGDWSESDGSMALDLLGVGPDFRPGRTAIDPPDGVTALDHRRALVEEELDQLEALRDGAMIPLDEAERYQAMRGDVALLSNRAMLLLRYERDAWKRYNQAIQEVKAPPPVVTPPVPTTTPAPAPTPVRAEVSESTRAEWIKRFIAETPTARTEAPMAEVRNLAGSPSPKVVGSTGRPIATERTQFAEVPVGSSGR